MRKTIAVIATGLIVGSIVVPSYAAPAPRRAAAARYAAPVKVTPDLAGGYEPNVVVDRFGNVFGSAHKENFQLLLAPDSQSPTMTRSLSWKWMSADDGKTFTEIPGLPLNLENKTPGVEGDMAIDGKDRLYFIDTAVHNNSITRWTSTGRGKVAFDFHTPVLPTAQTVDDRPWITAHGDGHVYYLGNQGDKVTYPTGTRVTGEAGENMGGRYTVYASHDGARTFDPVGQTLSESGWCRPEADPRSSYVYVICTNDGRSNDVSPLDTSDDTGIIHAYVSPDRGATWKRYRVGTYLAKDPNTHYPSVSVAPDGSLYALYLDAKNLVRNNNAVAGPNYASTGNTMVLFHSRDRGRTWKRSDITPKPGQYIYGWLSVAKDSQTLGLAVYHRAKPDQPWKIYSAIFKAGTIPTLTSLDDKNPVADAATSSPPGDYLWCDFGPDGSLSVMWTRNVLRPLGAATVFRDIFYARSVTRAPLR